MSHEGVVKLVTRALEDEGFRAQIKANPDAALAQFDLTPDEIAAIKSGDRTWLGDVAMDERVSKLAASTLMPQSLASTTYVPQSLTPSTFAPSSEQQESLVAWLISLFSTAP